MTRLLVLRHHEGDHLGRLASHAAAVGADVIPHFAPAGDWPAMDDFDALVVLGGAMQVWETDANPWLTEEFGFVRAAITEFAKPYLGICLGHQVLAHALGGEVGPAAMPEIGVFDLSAGPWLTTSGPATQWHSAEVHRPPDGFDIGAQSAACPIQSLHGPRAVHSVQFHPEARRETVLGWIDWPDTLPEMPEAEKAALRARFDADMTRHEAALDRLAENVFGKWWAEAAAQLSG